MNEAELKAIAAALADYVGKTVRVAITEDGVTRNHFGPQIAVCGKLETKGGSYRVMKDDENFTYFTPKNVVLVNPLTKLPTIMIRIDVGLKTVAILSQR